MRILSADLAGLMAMAVLAGCGSKAVDLGADALAGQGGLSGGTSGTATGGSASDAAGHGSVPLGCGNGTLEAGEVCDDGNVLAGDGCSSSCTAEPGWVCISGTCAWECGDRLVSTPEQCVVGACSERVLTTPLAPPPGAEPGPCDIYASDGGPCVAAHSTVRALYATYEGPLYQVRNASGLSHDIAPLSRGGFADSAAQDAFCGDEACTISVIYDQSGQGNHLQRAPSGQAKPTPGNEANAKVVRANVGGHAVYGLHIVPGVAYRNNNACGTATGDDAETEYMVAAGDFYNQGCCFEYGNVERDSQNRGEGSAEAVYFGASSVWARGAGAGPWVMADLENGLWPGDQVLYEPNESLNFKYVTAMVKGDAAGKNHWTIKAGNAQAGALRAIFDGARPTPRYQPMKKQGGISLGAAGDNSNIGQGNFFEGVMTAHYSTDTADAVVQANVISAYGSQ